MFPNIRAPDERIEGVDNPIFESAKLLRLLLPIDKLGLVVSEKVESFEDYLSPAAPFFVRKKFVNRFNELYDCSDERIKSDDN